MQQYSPIVYLVDDDPAIRDALSLLIKSVGLEVKSYADPKMFIDDVDPQAVGCIVLDLRMPNLNGFELQNILNLRNISLPQIFLSGHGDVRQTVRAIKAGAVDFLTKPVDDQLLLDTIQEAIRNYIKMLPSINAEKDTLVRIESLTPREREVLDILLDGHTNKEIARALNIGIRTAESHRATIYEKMGSDNLAQLCRICIPIRTLNFI